MLGTFLCSGVIGAKLSGLTKPRLWRVFFVAGALAGLYTSIGSGSRGGWIALPVIVAVFIAAYITQRNAKYVIATVLALIVAALAAVATVPAIEARYNQAASDIKQYQAGNPQTSLGYRLDMYKSLAMIIPQKPWLGWGRSDEQTSE